jgi:glutamate synthase (NADPH/NADH) small chain
MGEPTGFLKYRRELPLARDPVARLGDWEEFHGHADEALLKAQGARCMDCGIPFCHTGQVLDGLTSGCPINNLIPEWNDLVYRGLWQEALERLLKTNNFPEFTGRVCPAPCEGACVLGLNDNPVTIKNIECAIIDKGFEKGWIKAEKPERRTGKRIAIIGSGPAGLAAAAQLNKVGHSVTVFERADRAGGLLMYGIPNMKLDKSLVERRIRLMEEEGITFKTNCEIGKDIPADKLKAEYDAVLLAGGATLANDFFAKAEGRQLRGIHFAMEFLHASQKSHLDSNFADGKYISAKDKDVIVIGGGDTGTDCVGTALRHGCKSLLQFELLARPPLERGADNPWPQWPKVYKLDYGQEEAAARYGRDPREYLIQTKRFLGDKAGNLTGVETVRVEWVGHNGRATPREVPGSERTFPAQMVLLALGFRGPENPVLEQLGVERDARTNAKAAYGTFATNVPGVYAAGDLRRGQSLIVWAIAEGRGAAREIDRFLMGTTQLP